MADLYVMPSVSEPFGIAPLEAMSHDITVIISKQSGVSEVVQNALLNEMNRRGQATPSAGLSLVATSFC